MPFTYRSRMPSGVFSILPDNFFSVLSGINREHYAALLVLYYRLFQENSHGLERELVVREFMNYIALHMDSVANEFVIADDSVNMDESAITDESDIQNYETSGKNIRDEFQFDIEDSKPEPALEIPAGKTAKSDERTLASRFLKRLINAGWLGDETLADFTKVINITAWGKPFMKALADIEGGLKTEYESHVVTVYSLLCGETIKTDGHHAVLNAHEASRSLIDSLKVLSQSIKGFYDNLNAEAIRAKAASVLHEHYDLYMGEVLDKAYKRLKTSDNISRYRQGIFKQVAALLKNEKWLEENASKYMRILSGGTHVINRDECRKRLVLMLEEIRDDLKSVDPLEDEIDRRNAAYSRSSTEIIKAYIEPDSTVAGKIGLLIKALQGGNNDVHAALTHGMHRISFLSPSTLAFRQKREEGEFNSVNSKADLEALDQNEKDFLERMKKRLSIRKINEWLDGQGGTDRILIPEELIKSKDSYIRFVYALLYGDSRKNFGYNIEEDEMTAEPGSVKAADYVVPDVKFRKENYEPGP